MQDKAENPPQADIESSPHPGIFRHDRSSPLALNTGAEGTRLQVRTAARALAGMQKEALVNYGPTGSIWRIVCDEGPWLNGTDLAPFPLGYFSAGLTASYMAEFLTHAGLAGVTVRDLEIVVDNRYSMEGSLMRGTMTGGAFPAEVAVRAAHTAASAGTAEVLELARLAVASSPADALLRNSVASVFTLHHNGAPPPVSGGAASAAARQPDLVALFDLAAPASPPDFAANILKRLDSINTLGGNELGTERSAPDVGLRDSQKRQVHVRCVGTLRNDGLKELRVACFKPVGSVFRLLSDDSALVGGAERAPSGLAYLSAGLSFCFMTQLGRYAHVAKHRLRSYQVVQDTSFGRPAAVSDEALAPTSAAVSTAVFIDDDEDDDKACTLLKMGEQTCYLHAACRGNLRTRVQLI